MKKSFFPSLFIFFSEFLPLPFSFSLPLLPKAASLSLSLLFGYFSELSSFLRPTQTQNKKGRKKKKERKKRSSEVTDHKKIMIELNIVKLRFGSIVNFRAWIELVSNLSLTGARKKIISSSSSKWTHFELDSIIIFVTKIKLKRVI